MKMKYPSVTEVLRELESSKQSGEEAWWQDIIIIPTDRLVDGQGKLQVLYKGKPLYIREKKKKS